MAAETLERARLVSFTEKSQRYIKIGKDVLIPEEFNENKEFLKKYCRNTVVKVFKIFLEV